MNTQKPHTLFISETPAPLWQDKNGVPRVSAASVQPSTAGRTALNSTAQATNPLKRKHSTKRKTVFAGAWIDLDTDAYIEHRKKQDKNLTRSKVIATMLRERVQDDVFARSQAILVPIMGRTSSRSRGRTPHQPSLPLQPSRASGSWASRSKAACTVD